MRFALLAALTLVGLGRTDRRAPESPPATVIGGVVFDSLAMRGLPGATVQIADAADGAMVRRVETDARGRFQFADIPSGSYLLGFYHPKLDSLALESRTLRVDVRTEKPIEARLAIPSARTLARALCGRAAIKDSTGLFMGFLRSADNSMPRPDGTLSVRWSEIVIENRSMRREIPSVDASSGATGLVAICGLPLGTPILLQAASEGDSSGSFELTIPRSGFLHRDVYVAPFARIASVPTDSRPPVELLRGPGRLRGSVVAATGRPIPGARVTLWGTGVETTTNERGEFFLGALPGGTHTLDVRAVGFTPVQQPVDIIQGAAGATEVELANLGIMLDTVRVTARIYTSRKLAEFERRVRSGLGHYILEADIERRRPMFLTDLLRTVPGVSVMPGRYGGEVVLMRAAMHGRCRPEVFIDGTRIFNDPYFPLNSIVPMQDIRAVEVYARSLTVPAQFSSMGRCGAIVIWTGPRRK